MVDKAAALRDNIRMKPTDEELWQKVIQADDKDTRAIIARDFSASRMNATKWREMIEALTEFGCPQRFRWVYEPDISAWMGAWLPYPGSTYFDTGSAGPFRTFTIEWMEIDPLHQWAEKGRMAEQDQTEEIERRLEEVGVPYHREGPYIRIVGYVRNS